MIKETAGAEACESASGLQRLNPKDKGTGIGIEAVGLRISDLEFRALGFKVPGLGFRITAALMGLSLNS